MEPLSDAASVRSASPQCNTESAEIEIVCPG